MNEDSGEPSNENSPKPLGHLDNLLTKLKEQAEEEAKRESEIRNKAIHSLSPFQHTTPPQSINEIIRTEKARKQKIANDNNEKDQQLKEKTLSMLFVFLGVETFIIFTLAFFQGFKYHGFYLDQWSFRLVLLGTLGQITAMLTIAVHHLFPKK